jgi:hypothetical protein
MVPSQTGGGADSPLGSRQPICQPCIPRKNRGKVSELEKRVDKIVTIKQSGSDKDTSLLQREIDELAYRLYGLTEDEVRFVAAPCAAVSCAHHWKSLTRPFFRLHQTRSVNMTFGMFQDNISASTR